MDPSCPQPHGQEEEDIYAKAALSILNAHFVLVAAGAGFSADSGLPVYKDIANVKVYNERELSYHDLARPISENDDDELKELFYGFWAKCFNEYRSCTPHEGFRILHKWKQIKLSQAAEDAGGVAEVYMEHRQLQEEFLEQLYGEDFHKKERQIGFPGVSGVAGPFFIYTSNVDGHFRRVFDRSEVYEIHGSVDYWQCNNSEAPCTNAVWRIPDEFRYEIDETTLRIKKTATTNYSINLDNNNNDVENTNTLISDFDDGDDSDNDRGRRNRGDIDYDEPSQQRAPLARYAHCSEGVHNHGYPTTCVYCGGLSRPNVLLFGDMRYVENSYAEQAYIAWECAVERIIAKNKNATPTTITTTTTTTTATTTTTTTTTGCGNDLNGSTQSNFKKFIILEIGCGIRVPSVRKECENVLRDTMGRSTLIRINPDHPEIIIADHDEFESVYGGDLNSPLLAEMRQNTISIRDTGLAALRKIDAHITANYHQQRRKSTITTITTTTAAAATTPSQH